jgi:hypothetical protein
MDLLPPDPPFAGVDCVEISSHQDNQYVGPGLVENGLEHVRALDHDAVEVEQRPPGGHVVHTELALVDAPVPGVESDHLAGDRRTGTLWSGDQDPSI